MVYVEICLSKSIFGTSVNRQSPASSTCWLEQPYQAWRLVSKCAQIISFENRFNKPTWAHIHNSTILATGTVGCVNQKKQLNGFWSNKVWKSQPSTSLKEIWKRGSFWPWIFANLSLGIAPYNSVVSSTTSHLKERNICKNEMKNQPEMWSHFCGIEVFSGRIPWVRTLHSGGSQRI